MCWTLKPGACRALLLQDEDPDAAADWTLLKPLIAWLDKEVNEKHKFKLIAALQQRQHKNAKDFLDCCKTAWYGLLRKIRATYATEAEKAAHDSTRNECIECMFICSMHNAVRLAVEQIARNTDTLETTLAAAVQYKSAINTGVAKPGQTQRYGIAALGITGSSSAALSAPQSAPGPAGMHEMKQELAAISSALAALGVLKKGGKPKPPGGQPRGPRKPAPAGPAGGAGAGRSTSEVLGPVYMRDWIKCYLCRQWGHHIAAECTRTPQEIDNLTPGGKLPPSRPAKDTLFNPN
jgi:hypothetical protein